MADVINKPVILLAFANDRDDTVQYLRNLPDEARRLREVLEPAERAGLCELVVRTNTTASDLFKVLQDPKYRNRIAIIHYGGHANGYQLLLESSAGQAVAADAGGLAAFLTQQKGLQLVFLNGCSTQQQTQGLLDANISVVISTSRAIDDQVATNFAHQFYQGLAGGATIRTAYREAEAAVQTAKSGNMRALYFGEREQSQDQLEADRWPWNLYLREGSENADHWNLPEVANNPLFGLRPLPQQDLPESPYRHLKRFTRDDAEVFFGRGHQIRELYDRLTAPHTAPIMLFYGQSGVGKSSLLDAGLFPRLEQDYEVRYLRRTDGGLLETLQSAFLPDATDVPIETAWKLKEQQLDKPLIVILDQVEELYTRPVKALSNELDQLLEVVKATFVDCDQRPRGKLVLGFRKEWLAEIETRLVEFKVPRSKLFLEPLDRRGISEAVLGPTTSDRLRERYGLTIEQGLPEIMADDLLVDVDSAIAPTLQILLTKMWEKATDENYEHPHFSQKLYQQLRRDGILLRDFLNQQIDVFRQRYPEAVDSGLLLDIIALHTTSHGTADQRSMDEVVQYYSHFGDDLPELIQQCQDLHLLTVATNTQKKSSKATRLAHDTLAPLVREQFDESDRPGQRARRVLDNRAIDWEDEKQGVPLDEADLAVVERGIRGTKALTPTEQRLLQASRELRSRLQRTRQILKLAGIAAVAVITITAAVALMQRNAARIAKVKAEAAEDDAERQREAAIQQTKVAEAAKDDANQQREAAQMALIDGKSVVDEMLMTVASEGLRNVPQMEAVRTDLLNKASDFYEKFGKQAEQDSALFDQQLALADMHIGNMYTVMENVAEAEGSFDKAVQRFKTLTDQYPDQPEYQQGLANTYNWWGELWRGRGDEGDRNAWEKYSAALERQEELVKGNHAEHATYWYELARTHNNLGIVAKNHSVLPEDGKAKDKVAICAFTLVIAMLEKGQQSQTVNDLGPYLQWVHPDIGSEGELTFSRYLESLNLSLDDVPNVERSDESKVVLAWSYTNRANVQKDKHYDQAKKDYQIAIRFWNELLADHPDERSYQSELATVLNNYSNMLKDEGEQESALERNLQSIATYEQLAAAVPEIRSELGNAYMSRGAIYEKLSEKETLEAERKDDLRRQALKQFELAYRQFERLVESQNKNAMEEDANDTEENAKKYIPRFGMSVCNIATLELALKTSTSLDKPQDGEPVLADHDISFASHVRAAEAIKRLEKIGNKATFSRYQRAAWIMSRCILLAKEDQTLAVEDRKALLDDYSDRTIKLLRLAKEKDAASDKRYQPLWDHRPEAIEILKPSN